MSSIIKKLFGTLLEKPWEESQAAIDSTHSGRTFNLSNQMSAVIIIFGFMVWNPIHAILYISLY